MIDLGLSFADEKFPGVDLLIPKIRHQFKVQPINKPSLYQPAGESFVLEPD